MRQAQQIRFVTAADGTRIAVTTIGSGPLLVRAAQRFPLIGMSQGGAVAIAYAVRHPERVSQLVLAGACARGALRRATTEAERLQSMTLIDLVRVGWSRDNPAFRQVITNLFIPDGTPPQHQRWNELERLTVSPDNAARTLEAFCQLA